MLSKRCGMGFLVAGLLLSASGVSAQTYSNTSAITIPATGTAGIAAPYPSTIGVVGGPATAGIVRVQLFGVSHTFPDDLDILLVSPSGTAVVLMSDAGGAAGVTNATLTFSSTAPFDIPDGSQLSSGTFRPANYGAGDLFDAPAPAGPYGTDLNAFAGVAANGTWSLYIDDDAGADIGQIAGGWAITFGASAFDTVPPSGRFTYQGRLDSAGTPVNGQADLRFSLFRSQSGTTPISRVAGPITLSNVTIADGLFTVPLDFGPYATLVNTWLEIEVRNPAGGGSFTTLSPRQQMTATPIATFAQFTNRAYEVPWTGITGNPFFTDASDDVLTGNRLAVGGTSPDLINSATFFQVNATAGANSYGGMYLNGSSATSWPFYGYATNGAIQMWTYYNGAADDWRVYHNGDRLFLESTGYLGIGVDNPANRLELPNIANADGRARANAWLTYSSAEFKTNVQPIENALDKLERLQGVTFDWKPEHGGQHDIGFIAQRVAEVVPEVVAFQDGKPTAVDYSRLNALTVEALKQLRTQQEGKLAEVARENADLRARLEKLEALLAKPAKPE